MFPVGSLCPGGPGLVSFHLGIQQVLNECTLDGNAAAAISVLIGRLGTEVGGTLADPAFQHFKMEMRGFSPVILPQLRVWAQTACITLGKLLFRASASSSLSGG